MLIRSPLLPLFTLALLSACSAPADPDSSPSDTATPSGITTPVETSSLTPTASTAGPAPVGDIPVRFRAIGTEPFWSVQVQDGTLTYSTPDMPDGLTVPATMRRSGEAMIHSATIDGKPLELEVTRQICSDGMSDTVYPLAVIRRIGPDVQRGCAR
jgi:uncharacterized membrane protein